MPGHQTMSRHQVMPGQLLHQSALMNFNASSVGLINLQNHGLGFGLTSVGSFHSNHQQFFTPQQNQFGHGAVSFNNFGISAGSRALENDLFSNLGQMNNVPIATSNTY